MAIQRRCFTVRPPLLVVRADPDAVSGLVRPNRLLPRDTLTCGAIEPGIV